MFSEIMGALPSQGGPKAASIIESETVSVTGAAKPDGLVGSLGQDHVPEGAVHDTGVGRRSPVGFGVILVLCCVMVYGIWYGLRWWSQKHAYEPRALPGPPPMAALAPKWQDIDDKFLRTNDDTLLKTMQADKFLKTMQAAPGDIPLGSDFMRTEDRTGKTDSVTRTEIGRPDDIVPVHGRIPVWSVPEELPVEDHIAEPSIDELVRRREAATKELETFMASGLKQMGLKPVNPDTA